MSKEYRILEYLERLRPGHGDREKAIGEAREIAAYLKREYGAEVYGVGSLFNHDGNFTEASDIDLVVKGLPSDRFYAILVRLDEMTSFKLDIIPFEDANDYMRNAALEGGTIL